MTLGGSPMRLAVAAVVGLVALLGTTPSLGGNVEPVRWWTDLCCRMSISTATFPACSAGSVATPGPVTGHSKAGAVST